MEMEFYLYPVEQKTVSSEHIKSDLGTCFTLASLFCVLFCFALVLVGFQVTSGT